MLVLTRRIGEQILIGGQIRVTVTAIEGNRVRLGVSAPTSVRVDREEVHKRRTDAASGHLMAPSRTGQDVSQEVLQTG